MGQSTQDRRITFTVWHDDDAETGPERVSITDNLGDITNGPARRALAALMARAER